MKMCIMISANTMKSYTRKMKRRKVHWRRNEIIELNLMFQSKIPSDHVFKYRQVQTHYSQLH